MQSVVKLIALVTFLGGYISFAHSAEDCTPFLAHITSIEGLVELRSARSETWRAAHPKAVLCAGDQVRVGARGRAGLRLQNESTLRLDHGSTLTLTGGERDGASLLELLSGALHVITRTPQPFDIKTPFVNAGVDGTEFLVEVGQDEARIAVFEGRITASNQFGALMLVAGEMALVARGQAPRREIMVRPVDAVQWALYYPTIIDYRLRERVRGSPAEAALRESIDLYLQGRTTEALLRTDNAPEGRDDPRFLTYRAGLLLMVGRVDEATPEIQRALAVQPHYSDALALQAVIEVVQNDKEKALALVAKAVEFDPSSPTAHMALSYAQQAEFKIEEALASVVKALEFEPNSALAWARLSELQMSSRELDEARNSARRAVQLDAGVSKTQSVLGFANLTRFNIKAAKAAFAKAIELDQAEPLARLGLGLAKIREGNLTAGREEIEIAVSLDPGNGLLRSYMGKAYYEEKRDKLAGDQFAVAKALDPLDPTPWFYDAIRKQTENRPIEAVQDLQQSIELNDNRAVYRSRLLLDEDLAARSASQARVYGDIGFGRLAVVEGYKSLALDPRNFSAHRFLADSYIGMPRHEIARVSELLQSQLLQPISLAPLQPQLDDSKLSILAGAGPTIPGYNEFNSLFVRNRTAVLFNGMGGGRGTLGGQFIVSGIADRASYSVGQFHHKTDGFRNNNDLTENIYTAFVQASITHSASLQAEIRQTEKDTGDLSLRFHPPTISSLRQRIRSDKIRLGGHVVMSPDSDLIASAIVEDRRDILTVRPLILDDRLKSSSSELQYLLHGRSGNVILGGGYYAGRDRFLIDGQRIDSRISSSNAYVYVLYFPIPKLLEVQLGLGTSRLNHEIRKFYRTQINPKLGLSWTPRIGTTIRAAAFRTVQRPLISDQTIEPTQIAGFNQFFDDLSGADSKRYGIAIDHHVSERSRIGLEVSARRLTVAQQTLDSETGSLNTEHFNWKEQFANLHWYRVLGGGTAINVGYEHERFDRPRVATGPEGIVDLRTHILSIGMRWFETAGISASVTVRGVAQRGDFDLGRGNFASGASRFLVVDAGLSYRLPKRRGLVAIEARNLFDKTFRFQESDAAMPRLAARRVVSARWALAFF